MLVHSAWCPRRARHRSRSCFISPASRSRSRCACVLSVILTASRASIDRADLRLSVPEPVRRAGLAAVHQHRSAQRDPRLQFRHDGDGLADSHRRILAGAHSLDRRMRLMIDVTTGVMVLIGAYFVLGVGAIREARSPICATSRRCSCCSDLRPGRLRYPVPWIKPLTIIATIAAVTACSRSWRRRKCCASSTATSLNWRVRQEYESGVAARAAETGRVMRSYLDALEIDFLNASLIDLNFKLYRLIRAELPLDQQRMPSRFSPSFWRRPAHGGGRCWCWRRCW